MGAKRITILSYFFRFSFFLSFRWKYMHSGHSIKMSTDSLPTRWFHPARAREQNPRGGFEINKVDRLISKIFGSGCDLVVSINDVFHIHKT